MAPRVLYRAGEPIPALRVACGRVRLVLASSTGVLMEVQAIGPGGYLGIEAFLGLPALWDVEVLEEPTKLERVLAVEAMQAAGPDLLKALVRCTAYGANKGRHRLTERVALAVEELREAEGGPGGLLTTTHQRLSEVVGTTRESVSRAVVQAERQGLIRRINPHTYAPPSRRRPV